MVTRLGPHSSRACLGWAWALMRSHSGCFFFFIFFSPISTRFIHASKWLKFFAGGQPRCCCDPWHLYAKERDRDIPPNFNSKPWGGPSKNEFPSPLKGVSLTTTTPELSRRSSLTIIIMTRPIGRGKFDRIILSRAPWLIWRSSIRVTSFVRHGTGLDVYMHFRLINRISRPAGHAGFGAFWGQSW